MTRLLGYLEALHRAYLQCSLHSGPVYTLTNRLEYQQLVCPAPLAVFETLGFCHIRRELDGSTHDEPYDPNGTYDE